MSRTSKLTLTIVALSVLSQMGLAQVVQKRPTQEAPRKELPTKLTKQDAAASTPLDKGSREYRQIVADKKFMAACEILAADGEMFLAESGKLSRDGEKFAASFAVVNEAGNSPGAYRELVYAFDGKEAAVYFDGKNENFTPSKPAGGSTKKIKWPPSWWPGSGGVTIGSSGPFSGGPFSGGSPFSQSWGDWHEVGVDNCNFSFACPAIHYGKMRLEERSSNGSPKWTQTRWILIHCGCY
jgi:hypothetical protein